MVAARSKGRPGPERTSPRKRGKGAWLMLIAGVFFVLASAVGLAASLDDAATITSTTQGFVIDAEQRGRQWGPFAKRRRCIVDYQYTVAGEDYRVHEWWHGGCRDIRSGGLATVYYDPEDPGRSLLQDPNPWTEKYLGPILLLGLGAALTAGGVSAFRERR